jgi:GTP cyclohydrolase I
MTIVDVQSYSDHRNIAISQVGIKDYRHPVCFQDGESKPTHGIGRFNMYVNLPHHIKGTHMSRFIELLGTETLSISVAKMPNFLDEMITRLHATDGYINIKLPFFMEKKAPVSGTPSLMDYEVELEIHCSHHQVSNTLIVHVPVTSLCPCSKQISEYGAHNQRSLISISATLAPGQPLTASELIQLVESQASCALFSVLKRPDEKYVTEKAYENPKFVEDLVRDLAQTLNQHSAVQRYTVSSENFESIHNHSAFASISSAK